MEGGRARRQGSVGWEDHERAASLGATHPVEGGRDVVERDPVGDGPRQVDPAGAEVVDQDGDVAFGITVAVDAAGQRACEVEQLERVERHLLVAWTEADDHTGAAASYGGPGGADRRCGADALEG